jgi:hypothetical protein
VLGPTHLDTLIAQRAIANALAEQGRFAEAWRIAEEVCLIGAARENPLPAEVRDNEILARSIAALEAKADRRARP